MRPYVSIAGSGPSAEGFGKVTIATKKRSVESEYIAVTDKNYLDRWRDTKYYDTEKPGMMFRGNPGYQETIIERRPLWWTNHEKQWLKYFDTFRPKLWKPSVGTTAVLMAFERWLPEEIGLIGFDWVLDGNPDWFHDAKAELQAIKALPVTIVDLRDRRIITE